MTVYLDTSVVLSWLLNQDLLAQDAARRLGRDHVVGVRLRRMSAVAPLTPRRP